MHFSYYKLSTIERRKLSLLQFRFKEDLSKIISKKIQYFGIKYTKLACYKHLVSRLTFLESTNKILTSIHRVFYTYSTLHSRKSKPRKKNPLMDSNEQPE